jgi:hypothetical protein
MYGSIGRKNEILRAHYRVRLASLSHGAVGRACVRSIERVLKMKEPVSNRRDLLKLFGLASIVTVAPLSAVAFAPQRGADGPMGLPGEDATLRLVYRVGGPWGDGKGTPLEMSEVDYNFWILHERLNRLEKPSWQR